MKPILIASFVSALVAGFLVAATTVMLTARQETQAAQTAQRTVAAQRDEALAAEQRATADASNPTSASETSKLRDQVAALSTDVETLRSQLDEVRAMLARQAAPTVADAVKIKPEELAAVQHDAVVAILQEERDKEQAKRDEERKQREAQAIADRAARIAKELGLGAADERKLSEFMTVASAKRDEMFRGTRDGGFDRDTMRKNFDDYRTWAETELNSQFGANLGAQILQTYRDFGYGGDRGSPPWQGGQQQQGGSSGQGGGFTRNRGQ